MTPASPMRRLTSLLGMRQLTRLDLDSTAITDAGLKEIAKLKSLNDLSLLTEAERRGRILRTHPSLSLNQTRTTVNGIDELQRALPNCIVFASHLGFSPAPPAPGRSDRDWAQWFLPPNQSVGRHLFTDLDPETSISSYEELPPVDFHVVRASFDSDFMISETMLRRMAGLSKLRRLSFTKLSAPAFAGLGDLNQLEGLMIEQTEVTDDALQVLGNLTQLKSLQLGDKYLTDRDLAFLKPLHDLTWLRLNGKSKGLHGSGFGVLSPLTHLTSLDLDGSGIEDETMAPIGKLVALEDLDLSRTWITGKGLASLASLSRLKKLQLNGCGRLQSSSLEVLAKIPHLEVLLLNDYPLDNHAIESLKKLTSLRQLYVDTSGVPISAFRDLQSSLPNCSLNGSRQFDFGQQPAANTSSAWGRANTGGGFGHRRNGATDRASPAEPKARKKHSRRPRKHRTARLAADQSRSPKRRPRPLARRNSTRCHPRSTGSSG